MTEYVNGRDGLWHAAETDGTSLCGMGRETPVEYRDSSVAFAQCLRCLVRLWRRTAAR